MTRVVSVKKNGGPEVLEIKNIDLKDPLPDQVLIEQKAIGLNYIDVYHRTGMYPLPLPTFIHFVENYEIPEELTEARFGIQAFHLPELVVVLNVLTHENRLLELMQMKEFIQLKN